MSATTIHFLLIVFLLAGCATPEHSRTGEVMQGPSGFDDYCKRYPFRAECSGAGELKRQSAQPAADMQLFCLMHKATGTLTCVPIEAP